MFFLQHASVKCKGLVQKELLGQGNELSYSLSLSVMVVLKFYFKIWINPKLCFKCWISDFVYLGLLGKWLLYKVVWAERIKLWLSWDLFLQFDRICNSKRQIFETIGGQVCDSAIEAVKTVTDKECCYLGLDKSQR